MFLVFEFCNDNLYLVLLPLLFLNSASVLTKKFVGINDIAQFSPAFHPSCLDLYSSSWISTGLKFDYRAIMDKMEIIYLIWKLLRYGSDFFCQSWQQLMLFETIFKICVLNYYFILQTKKWDNETPIVMARKFENQIESSTYNFCGEWFLQIL